MLVVSRSVSWSRAGIVISTAPPATGSASSVDGHVDEATLHLPEHRLLQGKANVGVRVM
jgi:hypothetical protein